MTGIDRALSGKFNAGLAAFLGILFIRILNGNMINLLPL
jgi:hypothetical protein